MALFSEKDKVSHHLWGFNSPWASTELCTSDSKRADHNKKGRKLYQKYLDYFVYMKREQMSSMVKNNRTQALNCQNIKF